MNTNSIKQSTARLLRVNEIEFSQKTNVRLKMGSILNISVLALHICFLGMVVCHVHHVPDGMLNKCLNETPNTVLQNVRLYKCLDICRRVTLCESLDYNFKTGRCNMFGGAGADLGSLVTCQSFIHLDLVDWTEVIHLCLRLYIVVTCFLYVRCPQGLLTLS